ncbi:acyl-CoA desaturase [Nesterenkonia sp. NBAIMH1]|uniref:fatty acid desaturase family protein n=1 Tax=Nesterenkonia sp. NBAIMH1 TaxID=2600320 RepID=UPI0011B5B767|nr:acyl-CoA desaturase [Nesterenkonia sp. NBAIMH1]
MTITDETRADAPPAPGRTSRRSERRTAAGSHSARSQQTNDFFELSNKVKEAGLMDRRAQAYIGRVIALVLAFAGAGVMLVMLGESWWQLLTAVVFGVLFTQVAFLSHDAAHQQVFSNGRRNEWLSRIIGNGIVGLSYAWWAKKHGKHHANPNTVGKDGDIEPGFIAFIPEDAEKRTGFAAWFARRQGWMLFPLLTMFGWALHVSAVDAVIRATKVKHRGTEAALLAVRLIGFPLLVIWAMGPLVGLAFIAVQVAVFGVYMGASFAPNHKGMPVIPKDSKVDFLQRQILTARNIRGGRLIDWGMGGLNFQIEHHIFPRMPSPNLHKVKPIVEEFCAEKQIPYAETGLIESYGIVIRYLNDVGLGQADPMDCPIIAQYRTRG